MVGKLLKMMIRDNIIMLGGLDKADFSKALLQYRNYKDRDTGVCHGSLRVGTRDLLQRPGRDP